MCKSYHHHHHHHHQQFPLSRLCSSFFSLLYCDFSAHLLPKTSSFAQTPDIVLVIVEEQDCNQQLPSRASGPAITTRSRADPSPRVGRSFLAVPPSCTCIFSPLRSPWFTNRASTPHSHFQLVETLSNCRCPLRRPQQKRPASTAIATPVLTTRLRRRRRRAACCNPDLCSALTPAPGRLYFYPPLPATRRH